MGNSKSALVGGDDAQSLEALLGRPTALSPALFALTPTAHHGVPSSARTLAFCGRQGLLALGTASGAVKLIGRDELEVLLPGEEVNAGVAFLQFTARQRLVVAYTDSSVRVFDLSAPNEALAELHHSWTTSTITCVETIRYQNFPFVFLGTDDGDIHVLHEDSGRLSTYVISARDVGVLSTSSSSSSTAATDETPVPTAIAANPRDADQLLLAYDSTATVFLWDLAKRRVVREFTLTSKRKTLGRPSLSLSLSSASDSSSADWTAATTTAATTTADDDVNAPLTLSWHASGKRFAVGYRHGGFSVFRSDKSHGFYRTVADSSHAPIQQLQWLCAPPCSKNVGLAGALVFARSRTTGGSDGAASAQLTLVSPPLDVAADDALADLVKAEQLTWRVTSLPATADSAEIVAFAVASDQADVMAKPAPLSVLVLAGNPLDGCLPRVSVQPLPCFVRVRENDREDWEWRFERLPPSCVVPPMLQASPLTAFSVANVLGSDSALQDDLAAAWEAETYDPRAQLLASDDFEWPVNGGSLAEPLLRRFLSNHAGVFTDGETHAPVPQNGTLLLTGHANGIVFFWELVPAADRASHGALRLLHTVGVPKQMTPAPETTEIASLAFCHDARVLVVGFSTGEMAVLEFGDWTRPSKPIGESMSDSDTTPGADSENASSETPLQPATLLGASTSDFTGFKVCFSLHIHNQAIQHLSLSTAYGYVAAADAGGVVSLTHIASATCQLLVFELPSADEEPVSVESLLLSELAQTIDLPPASASDRRSRHSPTRQLSRSSLSLSLSSSDVAAAPQRELVPMLYVGRGNGKLEMFHVQSGTKVAESLVDPRKASSLSSLLLVDSDGACVAPPGRAWVACSDLEATGSDTVGAAGNDTQVADNSDAGATTLEESVAFTQRVIQDVLSEHAAASSSSADVVLIQTDAQLASAVHPWTPNRHVVSVTVPPGSLGLHLSTDSEQHVVVTGFVAESENAVVIEASGVRTGHVFVSINTVDVTALSMRALCDVLAALRDREKTLVFADADDNPRATGKSRSDPLSRVVTAGANSSRRFLVCACGRWVHLVPAAIPKASDMASGVREGPVKPLASVELRATVLATYVMRVPVADRVESCLVAIDQSNRVYVLSLLALAVVWESACPALGSSLDGVHSALTLGGELVVANAFGEVTRVSLLSEQPAVESALLARSSVKTQLLLAERAYPFAAGPGDASPKKKSGGIVDAGKLLKKFVTGAKDDADLNRLFQFAAADDERAQLFRGRRASASLSGDSVGSADASHTKQLDKGLGGTKDALMQATQHLHERGEKLGDLALKTEQMKQTSEDFYQTMKAFNDKNAKKKWYDF